jgi:hypothetical protein
MDYNMDYNMDNKVYTITYGDVAENHARMQKIGDLHDRGYSIEMLNALQSKLEGYGLTTQMVNLNDDRDDSFEEASVLVIRKGAQFILGEEDTQGLVGENDALTMDKQALMRGKVVNKHARWNLCFAEEDQEPDYQDGKGRVVSWRRLPRMSRIRQVISEWTEDVLLNGEANYYYDISKCGIGFHGDAERRKVFAVRMGQSMPLYFKWFQNSEPLGEPIEIQLHDGDMYIMSEKAVGFDWLKKKTPTLRHATGCAKYTDVPLSVPLGKVQPNLDQNLVHNLDQNMDQNLVHNLFQNMDQNLVHNVDQIMEKIKQAQRDRFDELMAEELNLGEKAIKKVGKKVVKKADKKVPFTSLQEKAQSTLEEEMAVQQIQHDVDQVMEKIKQAQRDRFDELMAQKIHF